MTRSLLLGALCISISPALLWAADVKSEIKALRAQIKALRAEEKNVVAAIKARYSLLIDKDKLSKADAAKALKALEQEKKSLLALAHSKAEKKLIREKYAPLEAALKSDEKLDSKAIAQLKAQQKEHVSLVSALYKAKIEQLQEAIAALEGKGKKPSSR
jgi:hypothetical protein